MSSRRACTKSKRLLKLRAKSTSSATGSLSVLPPTSPLPIPFPPPTRPGRISSIGPEYAAPGPSPATVRLHTDLCAKRKSAVLERTLACLDISHYPPAAAPNLNYSSAIIVTMFATSAASMAARQIPLARAPSTALFRSVPVRALVARRGYATPSGPPPKNFRLQPPKQWDQETESTLDKVGKYFLMTEMMRGMYILLEQFFRPP